MTDTITLPALRPAFLSKKKSRFICAVLLTTLSCFYSCSPKTIDSDNQFKSAFLNPPDSAKPGVYWYFMDGNLSKESMTSDLESMKKAGIGNLVFLEVNVGVPRGSVDFLSDQWQDLFKHAVREAERLGIEITLGIGPGWTGSGGPWVKAEQSMQHLVSATTSIAGGRNINIKLPVPMPKQPYFGEGVFTPELKKQWSDFYKDVAVLAYPTPALAEKIKDIDEKALYHRAPYSSVKGVKQYLPTSAVYGSLPKEDIIDKSTIIDLTAKLQSDGTLNWQVPAGNWTIVRFGSRNTGAITRPSPVPGLGFEADKFDTVAINSHLDNYIGKLIKRIGMLDTNSKGGLKRLHMDSWEMSSQNWTANFRDEFIKRRGYDPLPFYPVYAGDIVESLEISERFLWDLRVTSQELIIAYHAEEVKKYGAKYGLGLSIEPYDMNPTADLELGAVADVPMAEFWSKDLGFNSSFSCIEATSIAHVNGLSLVPSEAFTAQDNEGWKQYPGAMKNQGDWAFAAGINRFVYHTFQNQALPDSLRPGMTMGPYGVHWDRSQTWWPMVGGYHDYISRCQFVLQQGRAVADILYLTPEGAPHVFRPPASALEGEAFIPDRKGYNFDGCAPSQLYRASVKDHQVVFPGGAVYRLLVLPAIKTMTPELLEKIRSLVYEGAIVVGAPPVKAPGLSGYPASDLRIDSLVKVVWGTPEGKSQMVHEYGKGKVIWGGELSSRLSNLYPEYDLTATLLRSMGVNQDFASNGDLRYTHRTSENGDVYFVSNRTGKALNTHASFRSIKGSPQLWDPINGATKMLTEYVLDKDLTSVRLSLAPYQSFFVIFDKDKAAKPAAKKNFSTAVTIATLTNPWKVSFDPKWGGPANITFNELKDWTLRPEDGIKHYSGTAVYHQTFDLPLIRKKSTLVLDIGEVHSMARVKLNGKDLGVLWSAPWRVDVTSAAVTKGNVLEIEVVNLWPNRLIGDERLPDDGIKNDKWPEWLVKGLQRTSGRYTFTTYKHYTKDSPLLKSGLLGPVTIQQLDFN